METPTGAPRRLRVFIASVTAILAVLVGWLVMDTVEAFASRRQGVHGTVTVSSCSFTAFAPRSADSYDCVGEFDADDGELGVLLVNFVNAGELDPGERVTGTISGPGDDTMDLDEELGFQTLFAAAGVIAVIALLIKLIRLRPPPRLPASHIT